MYVRINAEQAILQELREHFSFFAPNYKWNQKFKLRIWDGKIRLLDGRTNQIYKGLVPKIQEFCDARNYELDDQATQPDVQISVAELNEFLDSLHLPEWLERRDYQLKAILTGIRKGRKILLCPTSSGKSFIIYCLLRWFDKKALLIVPTVMLTTQMFKDFGAYSENDPNWNVDEECSVISSGKDKNNLKNITISTWQSIYDMPKDWFVDNEFDVAVCDEVHTAQGASIRAIMEKLVDTPVRIGTTGTLEDSDVHEFVLTGLFGPAKRIIATSELIEAKQASDLNIKCLICQYSAETMKAVKGYEYHEEIDFIATHPRRNRFIAYLAISLPGNSLILCNFVEKQAKVIYDMIVAKLEATGSDKKVFFISGEVPADVREQIRNTVEKDGKNCIIVGTYGCLSTGVNIVALHNLIFAHPTKAKIRLLQSIGRILRRSEKIGKLSSTLFDIADELTLSKKKNYTYGHFLERLKIYVREKFNYKIKRVNLDG